MLAIVGYVGAGFSRAWAVAQRNPALKWALVALCLVFVVEVFGEGGAKVSNDLITTYRNWQTLPSDVSARQNENAAKTVEPYDIGKTPALQQERAAGGREAVEKTQPAQAPRLDAETREVIYKTMWNVGEAAAAVGGLIGLLVGWMIATIDKRREVAKYKEWLEVAISKLPAAK